MVGNLSNFTKVDILRCLLKIDGKLSRSQLSEELDLGEGTIRSILNILQEKKLLSSTNKGHFLNDKGFETVKKINLNLKIKRTNIEGLSNDKKTIALHLKDPGKLGRSYELRDEALKNGADGALILIYDKKLKLYDSDFKEDYTKIEKEFLLKNKDIVIITYADSYKLAEHGAIAVALMLNDELKSVI